jgi:acetolactate synthase small subunit
MRKMFLSVLVDNTAGVFGVAGLFSRRGYNIDSLRWRNRDNGIFQNDYCCMGDDEILEQIEKQVAKLEM